MDFNQPINLGASLVPQTQFAIPASGPVAPPGQAPQVPQQQAAPAPGADDPQKTGYIQGWRNFIQQVKTDPDMRMALFNAFVSLSQPAATPQEGIGRALAVGSQSLTALQDKRVSDAEREQDRSLKARETAVREGALKVDEATLAERQAARGQEGQQFTDQQSLARDQLAARLQEIQSDDQYKRDLINVRREEIANGPGQVNQRWTRLTNVLLQTQPQLFGDDPQKQRANAEAYAWDLMNADQGRSEVKAKLMSDQLIFLPDPQEDPVAYQTAFVRLSQQTDALLDASGLTDQRAFTPPGDGSVAPANPGKVPLVPGTSINLRGIPGTVVNVSDRTITIDFGDRGGQRTLDRSSVENAAEVMANPNLPTTPIQR